MPSQKPSYDLNRDTELAFVRQVLADPTVLPRLEMYLRPEGFDDEAVRDVIRGAMSYFKIARSVPTAVGALQEIREEVKSGKMKPVRIEAAESVIVEAKTKQATASAYLVDRILKEERKRALWGAIEKSLKLYQGGKHDEIAFEVAKAALVGKVDAAPGVDYAGTLQQRTEARLKHKAPPRWGTGIADLDDLTDGGLSRDNPLGIVLGGPKFGKSLFLDHVALHHMTMGGFAVYVSLEMGTGEVVTRHDAAISRVPMKEVHGRALEVSEKVDEFLSRIKGGLHVKRFPGGGVTSCAHIDAYLEQIRIEQDIRPTVIIVDYLDEMAADDRSMYERRHEELAAITGQLRSLADKHNCVLWTASQIKADALEKKVPTIADIAGAFAKAAIADLLVAICRTNEERLDGRVRFFVAASRFSADGVITGSLPSAYEMGLIVVESLV